MNNLGWHFVAETLLDGNPVPADGVKLVHTGPLVMCKSGLHLSRLLIDALIYAPGNTICRVEFDGNFLEDDDKIVASERTILWRIDGEKVLREFARKCALDVIHLWDAPELIKNYLETGDESLREGAREAAWSTARNYAWSAAWYSAWNTTQEAAWNAARAAVWEASRGDDFVRKSQNAFLIEMVEAEHNKQA